MSKLDIYYRALVDYRKHTRENNECARRRKSVADANIDGDIIEVIRTECDIEEDWIEAIETGLEYIGKAIAEERQFILSNGEILSIEKVKSVSRESVEHLAKHSNLLTKEPKEGEDIIPDKLYSVERLTDYAVYENRFLYMLLNYLKEFISVRYDEITELTTTYTGKMTMRKTVSTGNRQFVYEVTLDEKVRGDEFLKASNPSKDKIDRIDGLLKAVVSYLAMPIMDEVAKSPMLKPPITETNVLKMNRNFKEAMRLYYYITAYTKKGYTFNQVTKRINPFRDDMADEFAETAELSSFLTYEYGMELQDTLKANYEETLKAERLAEEKRRADQILSLRKRIRESGGDAEEYMLLLEQRIKSLEEETVQLGAARAEIERLNGVIEKKDGDIAQLNETIGKFDEVLAAKDGEIAEVKAAAAAELKAHDEEHSRQIAELEENYRIQTEENNSAHEAQIESLKQSAARAKEALETRIKEGEENYHKLEEELRTVKGKVQKTEDARIAAVAALNAIKQKHGEFTGREDYNSRKGFDDLEKQYNFLKSQFKDFKKLFKSQWKKTKKGIRKKYLKADAVPEEEEHKKHSRPEDKPKGKRAESPEDNRTKRPVTPEEKPHARTPEPEDFDDFEEAPEEFEEVAEPEKELPEVASEQTEAEEPKAEPAKEKLPKAEEYKEEAVVTEDTGGTAYDDADDGEDDDEDDGDYDDDDYYDEDDE